MGKRAWSVLRTILRLKLVVKKLEVYRPMIGRQMGEEPQTEKEDSKFTASSSHSWPKTSKAAVRHGHSSLQKT